MARFSFRKRTTEDEELPEGEGTGEEGAEISVPDEGGRRAGGGSRRILIIAGVGVILIGGWYLANQLFLAPPPPPQAPARPAVPAPPAKAPAPAAPTQEAAAPAATAKPPSKAEQKPAAPAKAGAAPLAAPAKPESAKAPPAEKKAAPPKAEAKAPTKPAPAPATGFSLQVGAMVMEENAETLKRKLDESGFSSAIRKGTAFVAKQVVTVGEPTGKREAEDLSRRLNVDGFPSQLLPVGSKYTPQIGAFFNLDEAIDLARELQKKNYHPKITSKPANTVVFQVRHGKFDSRTAAVRRGEELKAKGFNFLVVRE